MAHEPLYEVLSTQSTVYSEGGVPVAGLLIRVRVFPWNDTVEFNVPRMDAALIHTRVTDYMAERRALETLSAGQQTKAK